MKKNSNILFRVPDQIRSDLHAHARKSGITLSDLIRSLVERELTHGDLARDIAQSLAPQKGLVKTMTDVAKNSTEILEKLKSCTSEDLVTLLTPEEGWTRDMWSQRARSLVSAISVALCDLRDQGKIELTPDVIQANLGLGHGVNPLLARDLIPARVEEISEACWADIEGRSGLIPLYLRALKGELSEPAQRAIRGVFETLPGASLAMALAGEAPAEQTVGQLGYLSMQVPRIAV